MYFKNHRSKTLYVTYGTLKNVIQTWKFVFFQFILFFTTFKTTLVLRSESEKMCLSTKKS